MKQHKIKISSEDLYELCYKGKRFELRKDDRNYNVGDTLLLDEYTNGEYTGRSFFPDRPIQYILRGCEENGLKEGYCILSW